MGKALFAQTERGFSLFELIAVFAVLSVIAAIAIPRFVDLRSAARQTAADGIAGDLSTASASNLATHIMQDVNIGNIDESAFPMNSCDDAAQLLMTGLPEGYSISDTGSVSHLESVLCEVVDESDESIRSSFILIGINRNGS